MSTDLVATIVQQHYELPAITQIKEVFLGIANRSLVIETEAQKYFLQFNRLDGEFIIQLEHFQFKAALLHWLKTQGFTQVIAPIPTREGQLCIQPQADGVTYTLYEHRPQKLMYSEAPDVNRKAATSLTETIAQLHNLTRKEPTLAGQSRGDTVQFLGWMRSQYQTFRQAEQALARFEYPAPVQEAVAATFARLDAYYHLVYEVQDIFQLIQSLEPSRCLVHNDLNPTNLSFTPAGELETLYDFDNAHWDIRAVDFVYLYFYHYYSSPYAGQDYLDESLAEEMLTLYETITDSKILPAERDLMVRLTLAHILRAFLWLVGNLLRGTPLPVIAHGASRLRPQAGLPPAGSIEEDVVRTFNITFHVAEKFSDSALLKK